MILNYEFFIFNERKNLIFHVDFIKNPQFDIKANEIEKLRSNHRILNVNGISDAMKPFCNNFSFKP